MSYLKIVIRKLKKSFTAPLFSKTLAHFTQNKDYSNFFVRMLPSNLDFNADTVRRKTINGITYDLNLSQWMEYALYFGLKSENKEALYSLIKPGMVIFDVGANFGETTLNFAKLTGTHGRVHAFEPMPWVFEKCRHNIGLNSFSNIILENMALSNEEEQLLVNDPVNGNSGGIFTTKITAPLPGKIAIQAGTVDNYILKKNIRAINILKIDVEGFEMNVLKGADHTLQNFKPIIYFEICEKNLQRAGSSSKELIDFLNASGYKIFDVQSGEEITVHSVSRYDYADFIAR